MKKNPSFIFFGTTSVSRSILEGIKSDYLPTLIVTAGDKPFGRKRELRANPVKEFAIENEIEVLEVDNLHENNIITRLNNSHWDFFLVTSFPLIIPKDIIEIPEHGVINIHFSLLPKLRGGSPVRSAILKGYESTGTTVFIMDEKVDHGPILAQVGNVSVANKTYRELEDELIQISIDEIKQVIPKLMSGKIEPVPQDQTKSTYAKKFNSDIGYIEPNVVRGKGDSDENAKAKRKVLALSDTVGTYTVLETESGEIRLKITKIDPEDNGFKPLSVVPSGKKEMSWDDFLRGNKILD